MPSRICDLPHLALLTISGDDATPFLHGQLTLDLNALPADRAALAGWCNPKGRLLANFLIWRQAASYRLLLSADLAESMARRLRMYILRAQVTVTEHDQDQTGFGVCGEPALAWLRDQLPNAVPADNWQCASDESIRLLRWPGSEPRCLVTGMATDMAKLRAGLETVCETGNAVHWQLADIEAGLPWITAATSEQFLPQSLNLDRMGGLAYDKGCYPGQEIIARLHYRGEIKQRLRLGMTTGAAPQPGTPCYIPAGERDGTIVNAVPGATGSRILIVSTEAGEQRLLGEVSGPLLQLEPGWL